MEKVFVALAVMLVGIIAAAIIRWRAERSPAQGASWTVPVQLHRGDFDSVDTSTLIVVFSSATCDACAATWAKVQNLASDTVAVQDVPYQDLQHLHDRYQIDAVPTVLVADAQGVVTASFVGEPKLDELTEAIQHD